MADVVRGGRQQLRQTAGGRRRAGRGQQTTGSLSLAMSCCSYFCSEINYINEKKKEERCNISERDAFFFSYIWQQ